MGYKDVMQLKKGADHDPLCQREGFQKLVTELEGERKEAVVALPGPTG
jgi:hypothetical protein